MNRKVHVWFGMSGRGENPRRFHHKPRVWVHIKNAQGNTIFETNVDRDPKGLAKLQRYMKKYRVTRIVMESTSQYWIPVYKGLQRYVDEICVVNAYQLKVLGKHKTDKRDAELLATWGLLNVLKASFVPDMVIHELRQLVRARVDALNHRTAAINQLKTHLEGVCPGITRKDLGLDNITSGYTQQYLQDWPDAISNELSFYSFVSNVGHKSTQKALFRRQETLAYWWKRPLPVTSQHLVDYYNRKIDFFSEEIYDLERLISDKTSENEEMVKAVKLMTTIPGIGFTTAITVACELGSVERFDTAREAAASTGLTPKLTGSSGKIRAGKITKHGPKSVRRAVYLACKTVISHSERYKQFFYRIRANSNGMKAMVALCRKLVELCWTLWDRNEPFREAAAA